MSSTTLRFLAGALVCVVLASGCGDSKKPAPSAGGVEASGGAAASAPPAGMLDLLPEGTVGVVFIRSLSDLEAKAQKLAAKVDEKQAATIKVADLAEMLPGFDPADLDTSGSAAIAMTMASDSPGPGTTAIVPVRDAKAIGAKIKAKNPEAVVETSGTYAAITPGGPYKRGGVPAKLGGALPAGDVIVRLDVATLSKTLGPMMIQAAKEQLAAVQPAGDQSANAMLDGFKAALDASSVWDIAFRTDGTMVEAELAMTFVDRTKAPLLDMFTKADLPGLARGLPEEGMLSMAAGGNPERVWTAMSGFLKSTLSALPPAQQETLMKVADAAAASVRQLGPGMAVTGNFGPSGFEATYLVDAKDPAAFIKSANTIVSGLDLKDSFATIAPSTERTVAGTKFTTWNLKIVPEKLPDTPGLAPGASRELVTAIYGKDGLVYNVADLGKRLLIVIGNDDVVTRAVAAVKAGDAAPGAALAKAIAAYGADTVGFARMDVRALMRTAFGMMKKSASQGMPPMDVPAGDPVVITAVANAGSDQVRFRLSFDFGKFAALVKDMRSPR